jgi:hypothetical protein
MENMKIKSEEKKTETLKLKEKIESFRKELNAVKEFSTELINYFTAHFKN